MSDRRDRYRNLLCEDYLSLYDALCGCLSDDWQPYCGYRSIATQDSLYATGRTISLGKPVITNAPGGSSAHNYGCATDWTVFDEDTPIWIPASDPRWKEYEDACDKVGLLWGGEFKSIKDYYHNELHISCPWSDVKMVLDIGGLPKAMDFIKSKKI